jgi:putative lipoic acid-binding regulatory protein
MTEQKQEVAKEEETLVEFPCDFFIKVMGETSDDFANAMVKVIQVYAPKFDASKVDMRASSGGKFISLTCSVYVTTKTQLDSIYRALSEHPQVKYVL